ncbi:hypothetical protein [Nocardioides eburneiflavus]|uniref:hypothetical protein n=1 Tax=Nocardioides eburneiflavus TaxID=2518372 RepID=UPI00143D971E|nr:hypothetical protein [Nocardioides eburneiflavus]
MRSTTDQLDGLVVAAHAPVAISAAVAQHVVDTGTLRGADDRPPAGRPGPATASRVAGA